MTSLRNSLVLILVLLLLPWGAFPAVVPASEVPGVAIGSAVAAVEVMAPEQRKCRAGGLPGASCGPDIAVWTGNLALPGLPADKVTGQSAEWGGTELVHAPPTGPPRVL